MTLNQGRLCCVKAFTLVEILVVIMIIGVLLSISLPYYSKSGGSAQTEACINNLLKIDGAVSEFAVEHGKKTGDSLAFPQDLTPYIKLNANNQIPGCPSGGSYILNIIGNHPVCSLGSSTTPPHAMP